MDKSQILQVGLDKIRQLIKSRDFKTRRVEKGDFIIRQHAHIDEIYWSDSAQFSVIHTAENGKTLSLGDYFLTDNLFGEMEYFSDGPSPFSVIATTSTHLVVIPKERFADILLQDGHIAFWMNHRISNIYINTMSIAIDRSLYPLKFNIIKDLLNRHTSGSALLGHSYMYQEAQRFGCTERAYTRVIHELIKEGLVTKDHDHSAIAPVDIHALQAYLETYYN